MENHSFSPLYVAKLPVKGIYSLNKSTVEMAKPVAALIGPIAAAGLTYLETITQNLVVSLNKGTKSEFTAEVNQLDKDRDADLNEIKREVSSSLRSSNAAKKSAASALQLFLAPYWNVDQLAQDIETGNIADMLAKYNARPDLLAAAKVLDIDGLFVSVDAKNTAFDTKFKSRNIEYSERTESASSVKPAAVAAYMQFATAVEQMVNLAPNDTVIALFNQMDELRKKYHPLEGGSDAKVETTQAIASNN